jgi:putative aldouronate transport system substrate-binding protein
MRWKRAAAVLLAASVCLGSLGACSGKIENPAGGSGAVGAGNASPVDAAKKDANFNATGDKIVNEKETFDVWVQQTSSEKKAADREAVKKAEAATNVQINWIEIPESSWKEKVNISLASGDLPDAYAKGIDNLASYVERFQPLNELLDAYSPAAKEMFEELPELKASLADYNGVIRGLPTGDTYLGNSLNHQLWINQKWLKNVGMSMPTTTDEFEAVLKAFQEKDANGNGDPNDEIPFTFRNVWDWSTGCGDMFGPFGVVESANHVFVDPKDQTLKLAPQEDGYYKALQWLHKLYSEGLVQNTVFTESKDMYDTKLAGKDNVGAYISFSDSALGNVDLRDWYTDPIGDDPSKIYRHVPPLKGPDGDRMAFQESMAHEPSFFITTSCEKPWVLVRYWDYVNTGLENFTLWRSGTENSRWHFATVDQKKIDDYKKLHPDLSENLIPIKVGDKVPSLYDTSDWDKNKKWEQLGYKDGGAYEGAEAFAGQSLAYNRAGIISDAVINEAKTPDTKMLASLVDLPYAVHGLPAGMATKENSEARVKIKADLDTYLLRFISDSVMNGIDDAKWQTHLAQLKAIKADEYLKLCQEANQKINSMLNEGKTDSGTASSK